MSDKPISMLIRRVGRSQNRDGPVVNSRFIKVTPEDLERQKVKLVKESSVDHSISFDEVKKAKADFLSAEIANIQVRVKAATSDIPSGYTVLYRFHTGGAGLKSVAEELCKDRNLPQALTDEQKDIFIIAHAGQNKKHIDGVGFSPFVSMTSNLEALVRTSFTPPEAGVAGDTNIRQDVFERADTISAIIVPEAYIKVPDSELSKSECEACYDTQNGPSLTTLRKIEFQNPLKGHIEINLMELAISRGNFSASKDAIASLDRKRQEKYPASARVILTDETISEYKTFYNKKQTMLDELGAMGRPDRAKLQLMADERADKLKIESSLEPIMPSISTPLPLTLKPHQKFSLGGLATLTEGSSSDEETRPKSIAPTAVDPSMLEPLHPSSHTSSAPAKVRFHEAGMASASIHPKDITVSPIIGTGHVDVSPDPVILSRRTDGQSHSPTAASIRESGITSNMEAPDRHSTPSRITSPGIRGLLSASKQTDPVKPEKDKLQIVGKAVKFVDRTVPSSPHVHHTDERTSQIRAQNHNTSVGHAIRNALSDGNSRSSHASYKPMSTTHAISSSHTPSKGK